MAFETCKIHRIENKIKKKKTIKSKGCHFHTWNNYLCFLKCSINFRHNRIGHLENIWIAENISLCKYVKIKDIFSATILNGHEMQN